MRTRSSEPCGTGAAARDAVHASPDIHSSTAEYAARFAGAAGRWFLRVQEDATQAALAGIVPGRALDVGGCHGHNLAVLSRCGHSVTVLASEPVCFRNLAPGAATFRVGSLIRFPFRDAAFDVVLSYRLLTHLASWRDHVAELCRVSERTVIAEFPVRTGIYALAPRLFAAKRRIEGNTRPYAMFRETDVIAEFGRRGFVPVVRHAQYFWPMALHRLHGRLAVGVALEALPRRLGLSSRFGSPVILRFDRKRP
ncbi:MAG: methyltransferase domain-containing protein [Candidatus Krumholzibacteriia bacterium]